MLFSHCFLKRFLFSGGIFLKKVWPFTETIYTAVCSTRKRVNIVYKPQGCDSKPNTAVKSPKLLDKKFEKQCLEKIITLKVFL